MSSENTISALCRESDQGIQPGRGDLKRPRDHTQPCKASSALDANSAAPRPVPPPRRSVRADGDGGGRSLAERGQAGRSAAEKKQVEVTDPASGLTLEVRFNGSGAGPKGRLKTVQSADRVVVEVSVGPEERAGFCQDIVSYVRSLIAGDAERQRTQLQYADVEMDRLARTVRRAEREIRLSQREFDMLEYFLLHPERMLDKQDISKHVWGFSLDDRSNVIEVCISRLRRKIEKGFNGSLIHNVPGVGYRFGTKPPSRPASSVTSSEMGRT